MRKAGLCGPESAQQKKRLLVIDLFQCLVGKFLHPRRNAAGRIVVHVLHGVCNLGPEHEDCILMLHLALVLLGGRYLEGIVLGEFEIGIDLLKILLDL